MMKTEGLDLKELDLKEGKYPIIINPNLGNPILLNLRDFKENNEPDGRYIKKITFEAYILAFPKHSNKDIIEQFYSNIYIQPILKSTGDFLERRGERYPLEILEIQNIHKLDFIDQASLKREHCISWDLYKNLLKIENVFGKRKELHIVIFQIKQIKLLERLLDKTGRAFLLFDIVHDIPNLSKDKINYHSIALFNKDWKNFRFIHSTDFHVSRRNDFIINFMKNKVRDKIKHFKRKEGNKQSKIDKTVLIRDFEYKEEFQLSRIEDLRYSKFNFNYNLRLLIEFTNKRVMKKDVDFVLMTGDLIDYIDIARGNYVYKNNFQVFLDILLGRNKGLDRPPYLGLDKEFVNKEEIMVPIFTLLGNHDYRKGHYSLRAGEVRKVFGLTRKDIRGYSDIKFFNYFRALYSRNKFLKDYFRYFNPNLNFQINIGSQYSFIFIDTGQDSIADMHDLLKGAPSTKGLKDSQINLLRAYIKLAENDKIFIIMHTPPVSPNLTKFRKFKLQRKFKLKRRLKWSDFYEYNLKKYTGEARIDKIVNLKYQTIMYNWARFLKICVGADKVINRKVDLILCGHTHTLKEFRLKETQESDNINLGFYLAPIFINVPCEVYTNKYREIFKNFKDPKELSIWFDVNKPFIFQTQGIGPISLKLKFKPQGFRYITIANNQVVGVNVFSLYLRESITDKERESLQELGLKSPPIQAI